MSPKPTTRQVLAVTVPNVGGVQGPAGKHQIRITRDTGHPWDGRPGFDIMEVEADSAPVMDRVVAVAREKFWNPWLVGLCEDTGLPGAVFYKPCDIMAPWSDDPTSPHPGRVRQPCAVHRLPNGGPIGN